MQIPILTNENMKTLGSLVINDEGNEIERGVFNVFCDVHGCYYDCRMECLKCCQDEQEEQLIFKKYHRLSPEFEKLWEEFSGIQNAVWLPDAQEEVDRFNNWLKSGNSDDAWS